MNWRLGEDNKWYWETDFSNGETDQRNVKQKTFLFDANDKPVYELYVATSTLNGVPTSKVMTVDLTTGKAYQLSDNDVYVEAIINAERIK